MLIFRRFFAFISSLKISIVLLIVIGISSGIGTLIPQKESKEAYIDLFQDKPWLGFLSGKDIIYLQLDHVYTSFWFLSLLIWLTLSLTICSFRRQLPSLSDSMKWVDYKDPRQIRKLSIAQSLKIKNKNNYFKEIIMLLNKRGWNVKEKEGRIAARKGLIGKFGPPLVHLGLVLLMIGAAWGALLGEHLERFLITGKSLSLTNQEGLNELSLLLKDFQIDRDPVGRPEQFRSKIEINDYNLEKKDVKEISVNHPLRYKGLTIYQADWSLDSIILQIDKSQPVQLPLQRFPELGEEIWGIVIPTKEDGSEPILLSVSKENGPVKVFNENGISIGTLKLGGDFQLIKGIFLKVIDIQPSSGLLLKRDPGIPLVYTGFGIALIGGILSVLSTRKIWLICDSNKDLVYMGGLCNRNPNGLANELKLIIETCIKSNQ